MIFLSLLLTFLYSASAIGNAFPIEIPSKAGNQFRILLLGPGLNHPALTKESMPATLLEERLNKKCKGCYEVINAVVDGNFSSKNALLLQEIGKTAQANLTVYYESGEVFASDILESFFYRFDEDTNALLPKPKEEVYADACCGSLMKLLSQDRREKTNLVLNYVNLYKSKKDGDTPSIFTISDDVMRNFSTIRSFGDLLVLLSPSGFKPDAFVFRDDLLQAALFKFLIYFYLPKRVPLPRVFAGQGFSVANVGAFRRLYEPTYLMYRHPYNLNSLGAEEWSKIAARAIRNYLEDTGKAPREH